MRKGNFVSHPFELLFRPPLSFKCMQKKSVYVQIIYKFLFMIIRVIFKPHFLLLLKFSMLIQNCIYAKKWDLKIMGVEYMILRLILKRTSMECC